MVKNVKAGFQSLINPQSSEFWALIVSVLGYVLTSSGWIPREQWDHWSPGILTYIGARFVSKTAKG